LTAENHLPSDGFFYMPSGSYHIPYLLIEKAQIIGLRHHRGIKRALKNQL